MRLNETIAWAKPQVADGVIRNVKLLGEFSRNNRIYPIKTRQDAHKLMEGAKVSLNHSSENVESRIGRIVNVREHADGSYGDFEYLTTHPYAPVIREAAEKMPEVMGFSIRATGKTKKHEGKEIVECIDSIMSIDLVDNAGTTKGLFEAAEPETEAKSCEQIMGELIAALVAEGKEDMVKDAIKLKKKLSGDKDDEPNETPQEEKPAEESYHQEYQKLKLEKDCRLLLESANLPVETPLLETLTALPDDQSRQKFLAWHRKKSIVKQTKSSDVIKLAESQMDYAKLLRGK
jgi:hypothetical protein